MQTLIQLGHAHALLPLEHICQPGDQPTLLGYAFLHYRADGGLCDGVLRVCKAHAASAKKDLWEWETRSGGALTLKPSLLCEKCGEHGFVVDGKWKGV